MYDKFVTPLLAKVFTGSFLVMVGSLVGLVVLGLSAPEPTLTTPVAMALLILLIVAACSWYITLGIIASRLNRPSLAWVGLSLVTAPVGPLVAYPLMLRHIKTALTSQAETMIAP